MIKLVRTSDNNTHTSNQLSFIEWEDQRAIDSHDDIKVGYSCLLGPRNKYFTLLTTDITAIIEDTPEFKHFKTKHSEYKLYIEEE